MLLACAPPRGSDRLHRETIGSPWPKHAVSTSRAANRWKDATVRARSWLNTPSITAPTLAMVSPVNSTPCAAVDRDAALGVPGNLEDVRAAAEVEHVAVVQLAVHGYRRRDVGQAGRNPFVDRDFPVFEHRRRHVGFAPDDGGVAGARHHRRTGGLTKFGGRTDVVDVAVRQHNSVDIRSPPR